MTGAAVGPRVAPLPAARAPDPPGPQKSPLGLSWPASVADGHSDGEEGGECRWRLLRRLGHERGRTVSLLPAISDSEPKNGIRTRTSTPGPCLLGPGAPRGPLPKTPACQRHLRMPCCFSSAEKLPFSCPTPRMIHCFRAQHTSTRASGFSNRDSLPNAASNPWGVRTVVARSRTRRTHMDNLQVGNNIGARRMILCPSTSLTIKSSLIGAGVVQAHACSLLLLKEQVTKDGLTRDGSALPLPSPPMAYQTMAPALLLHRPLDVGVASNSTLLCSVQLRTSSLLTPSTQCRRPSG